MKKVVLMMIIITCLSIFFTFCKSQDNQKSNSEMVDQSVETKSPLMIDPQNNSSPQNQKLLENEKKLSESGQNAVKEEIPDWAIKTGITLPQGLKFLANISQITSIDNPVNKYNSINFVYVGEYQKSMEQAEIIASKANISLNSDFKKALENNRLQKEQAKKSGINPVIPEIKGAIYSNYSATSNSKNIKYLISITVEENGTLTISVIDQKQLNSYSPE